MPIGLNPRSGLQLVFGKACPQTAGDVSAKGFESLITLDQLCWLATAAYALHVLEEYIFDWKSWASDAPRLWCDWPAFYLSRSVVVVLGIVAAQLAPQTPNLALCFPGLLVAEATFGHMLPAVRNRDQFPPGLLTSVLLFYPLGFLSYRTVFQTGLLTRLAFVTSLAGGALLAALPLLFLKLRATTYFLPIKKR